MAGFRVFEYLNAPKSDLYRAIIAAFVDAKSRFRLHLRNPDVLAAVAPHQGALCPEDLEIALRQLCDWGNVEAHPDTADATTLEEFLRPRFLYQLTRAGEAAEDAIRHYEVALARSAQLQTAALADVRSLVAELSLFSEEAEPDEGKVHRALRTIWARFDELTSEAQSFLGALQRTIDLRGTDFAGLVAYKQKLIDYLERFIRELIVVGSDIADQLRRIDQDVVHRLLLVAARRDLADALDATPEQQQQASDLWLQRWDGLWSWFVGTGDTPPLAESLRARARAAIPALLSAIAGMNESRLTRTDRAADLRTLARWFAEAETDTDAHRLWRAAFGLAPARHLVIDNCTLEARDQEPIPARASWLEAPPIMISPRLRSTGRSDRAGVVTTVMDCSAAKAQLKELAREEAEQIAAARNRLAGLGQRRLSDLGCLDRAEFQLFLDILGEALARQLRREESVEILSIDGTLRIHLRPTNDNTCAKIKTADGLLIGEDHFLSIEDVSEDSTADAETAVALAPNLIEAAVYGAETARA